MKSVLSTNYYVHFQENAYVHLNSYFKENFHSKVFILVDTNTKKHCLPILLKKTAWDIETEVICIEAGESHKNITTCTFLWNRLSDKGADRKSIVINLGGGVITDMGGFVASTFKRGVKFINIPTTLLSMVDASVGGKTGVDLGALKNQVGLFSNPEMVLIDMDFLLTVSQREMRSGLAEIIKYGFTFDEQLWDTIKNFKTVDISKITPLVHSSVEIKNNVVLEDLLEHNLRKSLNFGHTVGHALESYFLESPDEKDLTHGEAIAAGMVIELFYSSRLFDFPFEITSALKSFVIGFYGKINLKPDDLEGIISLMKYDKKNVSGKVNFVLMEAMGKCRLDVQVNSDLLQEGLRYFMQD